MTKIVVNGTFDILHPGHVAMLNYAKSLGVYLLVLIDSDRRVKELVEKIRLASPDIMVKGSDYIDRPILGQELVKKIEFYDRTEHSTTKIIQDIINR